MRVRWRARQATFSPVPPQSSPPPFAPFLVPVLGTPGKAGVMSPLRPRVGPPDGGGEGAWAGGRGDGWG